MQSTVRAPSFPSSSLCVSLSPFHYLPIFLFFLVIHTAVCLCGRIDTRWALAFCVLYHVCQQWMRTERVSSRHLRHKAYISMNKVLHAVKMLLTFVFYSLLSRKSQLSRTGLGNVCRTMLLTTAWVLFENEQFLPLANFFLLLLYGNKKKNQKLKWKTEVYTVSALFIYQHTCIFTILFILFYFFAEF